MEPSNWVTWFALAFSKKTQSESKISSPPSHIHTVCKKYHIIVVWPVESMSMYRTNKTCRWWRLADVVHTAGGVRRKKFNIWPGSRITPQLMLRIYFTVHFSLLPFCLLLVMPKWNISKQCWKRGNRKLIMGCPYIYYDILQYYRGRGGGISGDLKFVLRNIWTAPKEGLPFPSSNVSCSSENLEEYVNRDK